MTLSIAAWDETTGQLGATISSSGIDWDDDPVSKMFTGWDVCDPQIKDYITRALEPGDAPSYGLPGDL